MPRRIWIALALSCLPLLAACGGGSSSHASATVASVNAASPAPRSAPAHGFAQLVAFGDSLSDDGAYTLAAIFAKQIVIPFTALPYPGGGQFTVNGSTSGNWTSVLASALGIDLNPNIVGYGVSPGLPLYLTPGGATLDASRATCAFGAAAGPQPASCTNFAQGGSMVVQADGTGHDAGALTLPVVSQLQSYLRQFGRFQPDQLVTILAGSNDVLAAFEAMQGPAALPSAQDTVREAADQLAQIVQDVLDDGASYVLVDTLPDSALTPYGQSLSSGRRCDVNDPGLPCGQLSRLVQTFNQRLLDDLFGKAVKMFDGNALLAQEIASPQRFALSNTADPWCAPQLPSSLLCAVGTPNLAAGASLANLDAWLFADSLHPTPAGHRILAGQTLQALRGFGWVFS